MTTRTSGKHRGGLAPKVTKETKVNVKRLAPNKETFLPQL